MSRTTLNMLIDVAVFGVMLAMIATGLLIRFVLPPGSGERRTVWEYSRHDWGDLHFWMACALGSFVLVHAALHRHWVCSLVSRWFRPADSLNHSPAKWRRNLYGVGLLVAIITLIGCILWTAQHAVVERDNPGRQYRGGRGAAVLIPTNERAPASVGASDDTYRGISPKSITVNVVSGGCLLERPARKTT